jgi:arsenate reductase
MKKRVLFLCTGNSARSQMAEALVNHDLGERWQAVSAGVAPAGYLHPLAVQAMAEIGISMAAQRSKPADEFRGTHLDLVITVCDHAAETCPIWLGRESVVHLGFPDPAAATGSTEERLAVFCRVRDDIRQTIRGCLTHSEEENHATTGA